MKSVNALTVRLFTDTETETNKRGNAVKRINFSANRYIIDFADDFRAEGWEQFDTDQDAEYFGFWINKATRQTLTYCEGDWIFVQCPDDARFNAEIEDAIRFFGEGFIAMALEANGAKTTYRQSREQFLIA